MKIQKSKKIQLGKNNLKLCNNNQPPHNRQKLKVVASILED